jgi:hypothetical protein
MNELESRRIVFGKSDDPAKSPLVELARYLPSDEHSLEEIKPTKAVSNGLEPFLQQAPALAAVASASANTYLLTFSPEVTRGLMDGSLSLMPAIQGGNRAIAIAANGQIVEHAVITTATIADPARLALVVWQSLAIVTAQKYLAEINARLARIEKALDEIKAWLNNDRIAKLYGNYNYLRKELAVLNSDSLVETRGEAVANQIEAIVRECGQIGEAYKLEMQACFEKFKRQNLTSGPFSGGNLDTNYDAARKTITEYRHNARGLLVSLLIRDMAVRLYCALPTGRGRQVQRLDEISSSIDEHDNQVAQLDSLVTQRMPELQGWWTWKSSDQRCQTELRDHCTKELEQLRSDSNQLRKTAAETGKCLTIAESIKLVVEVSEKQEIKAIKRVIAKP